MQRMKRKIYTSLMIIAAFLMLLTISGCGGGGVSITPLSDEHFSAVGKEMAAIESLDLELLQAITVSELTVSHIELISQLSDEELSDINAIKSSDIEKLPLGYKLNVLEGLTDAQKAFIVSITSVQTVKKLNRLTSGQLEFIDNMSKDELEKFKLTHDTPLPERLSTKDRDAYTAFFIGYIFETLGEVEGDRDSYKMARGFYLASAKMNSNFSAQSYYRLGILNENNLLSKTDITQVKTGLLAISRSQNTLFKRNVPSIMLWVRTPDLAAVDGPASIAQTAENSEGATLIPTKAPDVVLGILDTLYKTGGGTEQLYHQIVDRYVNFFDFVPNNYGPAVALIVLALLIKVLTTPLTIISTKNMRSMQKIQPMLKELQEKYPDDKQKQAAEQMRIMKENKVNPMGGCLPLLIQLPIFIIVYRAVMVYVEGFSGAPFLWIQSLAEPNFILLLLYAASMILSQKLTMAPSTDPQQKMMQTNMTYLMPIFLLFILVNISSGFVLYWFFLNVFSSLHMYFLNRGNREEAKAAEIVVTGNKNSKGSKK